MKAIVSFFATPDRRPSIVRQAKSIAAACGCAALLASGVAAHAATYSARNDFSVASNPNGVWSYGTLSSFTGGALTLFGTAESNRDFTGERLWDNNGTIPNRAAVYDNVSGSTVTVSTVVVPTDQLILDGESFNADVRWTAPAAGTYNVSGLFQRADTNSQSVSVRIVENGTTVLFGVDNFNGNGSQQSFALANLVLPMGTTLDFAEGAGGQPNNDSTGLSATITTVPEPGTLALGALGAVAVLGLARKRRR